MATLSVTLTARDGLSVPMDLEPAELAVSLLGGPRVTDGELAPGGWTNAWCRTCGDHAAGCPDIQKALHAHKAPTFITARAFTEALTS